MEYEKEIEGFEIKIISDKENFPQNGSKIIVNKKHLKEYACLVAISISLLTMVNLGTMYYLK